MLDEKLLKQISGAYDLELVTRIDLSVKECAKHGIQKLSSLEGVAALVNLVELDISGHKISDLSPLGSLQKLERVNLSNNELTGVNGLQQLNKLENLSLQGNLIRSLDHVEPLVQLGSLKHLVRRVQ